MGFNAMDYSVTVVAYEKENVKRGMCCAWAMQVDYDKLMCLLGEQSDTGKHLKKGDIIGVSVLGKNQKDIAIHFGEGHSDQEDKFRGISMEQTNSALTVPKASRQMICKVLDVLHLNKIEKDHLVYLEVVAAKENNNDFLHYSEL